MHGLMSAAGGNQASQQARAARRLPPTLPPPAPGRASASSVPALAGSIDLGENPDSEVDLPRSALELVIADGGQARRIVLGVARPEPDNLAAWRALGGAFDRRPSLVPVRARGHPSARAAGQQALGVCQEPPLVVGVGLVDGSVVVDEGSVLACVVVVEEESVVGEGSAVVVVVPPSGEVSVLAGAVELVSVVGVLVGVEESVLAGDVADEESVLADALVESVLVGGGVEVDVALTEVESLGPVELPPLESPELDGLVALVDDAGLEPEPAGVAEEPPVDAVVGAGTDVVLALPAGVGSELGAAGGAAGGETLLMLAAIGTAGIAGVAWR